ncbi:MAG: hypothetical protein WA708_10440 [Acidobacteriaceae bacterium]
MKFGLFLLMIAMSGTLMSQTQNPAPNAGATPTTSQTDLSGRAISACGSITSPGDYYLSQNLSCPGTALLLSGPGINLNLNGHTITYGTAGGTLGAVYGIENDACWDTSHKAEAVPCDNKNAGLGATIYGGTIVQSTRAPEFSHAFFFGQDDNDDQTIDVYDVTITIQQPGTMALFTQFLTGQMLFEHNTIYDNVKSIVYPGQGILSARSNFQGQAIHVDNSTKMRAADKIDNNKIIGSPQGGIRDTSTDANVFQNDISMNSTYTNDFCVDVPGVDEQVYSNYCHPVNGRGIHINGEGSRIYSNTIVATEATVNTEYAGCEIDGAFGIQIEDDIQQAGGMSVTGNNVTVNTGACGGSAIRISGWEAASPATVSGNTLTVNKTAGADLNSGVLYSIDGSNLAKVTFGGDTLKTSDEYCSEIGWDGAQNFTASLSACKAPNAIATINAADEPSSFKLTNAPAALVCGAESVSNGTINGTAVKCPK